MAKASTIKFLVRRGSPRDILVIVRRFWQSETHYLGLRRDLCVPFTAPSAKVPIKVRELKPSDVKTLLDTSNPTFSTDECILRHWQRKIVEAEIKTCFVAVTADDTPCYMQWLIGIEDLPRAKAFYGDQFPQIGPDEAILEGAFTPAEFRGQGIMPAAMALISEEAARRGARSIITFVANDNVPALKGCQRAGYEPYLERTRCWSRFRRKLSAVELPKGTPYPYEQENRATTA